MTPLVLTDVIRHIRDLPSLPTVVIELIKSFEQEDASVAAVAEKVSRDQALAAKTLRLANSSFYGLQHKVKTIPQAITVLGFDSVRALIVSAGVIGSFSKGRHDTFDFAAFWQHSIGVALSAKSLARALSLNQDYAFISGLLHDVGRLVLVTRFAEPYADAVAYRDEHDCYMLEAERAMLGLDHAMVGQALAENWKFPPAIQRAIANHHAPAQQDLGAVPAVIHVANAIMHALDLTGEDDDLVPSISEDAWKSLNLNSAILAGVFRETESEFEEACRILAA